MPEDNSVEPIVPDAWEPYGGQEGEPVRIRDIRTILTAPDGIRLVIVKVETTEPGLYGVGCATFTQRPETVVAARPAWSRTTHFRVSVGKPDWLHQNRHFLPILRRMLKYRILSKFSSVR